jgi:putative phosphoesterase
MRLAVISDIHGNVAALRAVIEHLRTQGVDATINLGDCVTAPLWPHETLALLDELKIPCVRGNHDRWLGDPSIRSPTIQFVREALSDSDIARLGNLPASITLDEDVLAVHGTPSSDMEYLLEDSVDDRLCPVTQSVLRQRLGEINATLVLCGHSHQQRTAQASRDILVVNPGSVGCSRNADNPRPSANEASSPHARYAIITRRKKSWSAELFALAYDWESAAERARSVGRADWADAFLS